MSGVPSSHKFSVQAFEYEDTDDIVNIRRHPDQFTGSGINGKSGETQSVAQSSLSGQTIKGSVKSDRTSSFKKRFQKINKLTTSGTSQSSIWNQ